ncbi:hypothetical protein [Nocardia inohanensis]|uniref:hypothetical protein n=1 Tax=Nocardia inohanensis TaxID=209246 RepID=UPI00082BB9D1|nr:hypothetical protein [Nocardia inohanensis]
MKHESLVSAGKLTRRNVLGAAVAGVATGVLGFSARAGATPAAASGVVSLPDAAQIRADYGFMADLGPRLAGYPGLDRFCDWIEGEFRSAGLQLLPSDLYSHRSWMAGAFGLEVLGGSMPGPVSVGTTMVGAAATPPGGVTGPLVHAGRVPLPSVNGTDPGALTAALAEYPAVLDSWVRARIAELGSALDGAILVLDAMAPLPLVGGVFLPQADYLHWPGHSQLDWAQIDYKRLWMSSFPALDEFAARGVEGVVLVQDVSAELLRGNYSPHRGGPQELPVLVVDRDTGNSLRRACAEKATARLTLEVEYRDTTVRSVTAVLPGESDEVVVVHTHTDGQNAFEENGAVALVHLARHFASLPDSQRYRRTLVFAAWPGHMTHDLPEAGGWIDSHPDIVARTAVAVSIEHLGATEWIDSIDRGYHATGENEMYAIWTTGGVLLDISKAALGHHDLTRHALLHGPREITPGNAFARPAIPRVSGIAGPTYLVRISPDADIDKLDAGLASRQTAFYADVIRGFESHSYNDFRDTANQWLGVGHEPSKS